MDALVSILGAVVAESGRILCGCVYPNFSSLVEFQSNFDALGKETRILIDLKNGVKELVESEERNGKVPTTQVKKWLSEAEEIEVGVNLIQAVKVVEQIPGPSIEGQTTASRNLGRILDLLEDDGVRSIGIWGMGGVGNTTLVKNLNNRLESTSLAQPFSLVLWVTVSKDMDLKSAQSQIARRLNLPIEYDVQRMAIRLSQRLKMEKKFLLILDDIWERIDLDDVAT
ncbi:hypothetical protein HHK36_001446 [Tetracentron sinense]|uniref:NB-ARC domain-containing protein n=1 Tax=Tetracentron sinense TaxID=13715 RepID=A0A834ZSV4_TETSI|nr:hypothetical protein HHK36_001446 [Tetracentron sinense]